jgi:hypothetical protein
VEDASFLLRQENIEVNKQCIRWNLNEDGHQMDEEDVNETPLGLIERKDSNHHENADDSDHYLYLDDEERAALSEIRLMLLVSGGEI